MNLRKTTVASIYHDIRHVRPDGTCYVKLRVYSGELNKRVKFYNTGISVTKETFDRAYNTVKPRGEYKELNVKLKRIETKAQEIIDKLDPFLFDRFEKEMFRTTGNADNVFTHYQEIIKSLESDGRIGTKTNYSDSYKSIRLYASKGNKEKLLNYLSFKAITPEFLKGYERWMLDLDKSPTTVGIYLRPLRALFNTAIADGVLHEDYYPFGKRKYVIPSGRKVKKALREEYLTRFYHYHTDHPDRVLARAYWFLSFQCNGANIKDIVHLKRRNIQDESVVFLRNKTFNTTKSDLKPIVAKMTWFVRYMIETYGNQDMSPDAYVFPIIDKNMSDTEKHRKVKNFIRYINQHVQNLLEEAGLPKDVSTIWARHTNTTKFIRDGGTLEGAQKNLGHHSIATTGTYWDDFEDNVKMESALKLMDFAKNAAPGSAVEPSADNLNATKTDMVEEAA